MKFEILLIILASTYAIADEEEIEYPPNISENWIEQRVNHFDLFDKRTWKMRYFVNNEFFQDGQPLFIDVAGEWEASVSPLVRGQMYKLAQKHKGLLIATEHRYYGKSLPFGTDFSLDKLQFLQIEQALEDLVHLIEHYKKTVPGLKNSKVIVHGCSYPGMLVTWLRVRFPNVVDIAYASSAPLGVGLDYPEYYEVVHDVYANVSEVCVDIIRQGFNQTQELMKLKAGLKTVKNALRNWGCGDVDEMSSGKILSKMVEVLNVLHDPLDYELMGCLVMLVDDVSYFHRLANFIVIKSRHRENCRDYEDPSGVAKRTNKAWHYQTCTEMGTFRTMNRKSPRNMFQIDLSLQESVDGCVKDFGTIVNKNVLKTGIERVERRYGGKKPDVTKVITVQGTHDPWKHLAEMHDYNKEAPVMVIEGSHCSDVSEKRTDSEELIEARSKIRDVISKWIEEIS